MPTVAESGLVPTLCGCGASAVAGFLQRGDAVGRVAEAAVATDGCAVEVDGLARIVEELVGAPELIVQLRKIALADTRHMDAELEGFDGIADAVLVAVAQANHQRGAGGAAFVAQALFKLGDGLFVLTAVAQRDAGSEGA